MAKYYGKIGYAVSSETVPGVWNEGITERDVYGDVIKNTKRADSGSKVIDDISVSMSVSFLADAFAINNFHLIKYATYLGSKWKVTTVEVEHPRLVLTLGGVYNGDTQP